ncbi:MAG TPA: hypothetical protein VN838_24040 [Bradyrhizobium sp.]|nr:hypothetical protein [Bradyrhizobium sp.]
MLILHYVPEADDIVKKSEPDISEDRRRLDEFKRTGLAVPLDEVKAWVASWGSAEELPRPQPRKIE